MQDLSQYFNTTISSTSMGTLPMEDNSENAAAIVITSSSSSDE